MTESIRVLIVEDLPTDAELGQREVMQVLPASEFLCVESREDFLAALDSFRPDIILSDYKLPRFDGLTALKLAKERAPEIPFIIVTGSMNEDTAVECMKAGAWDYVIKEHVKRLGPAVMNGLEQMRLRREKKAAEERSHRWERLVEEAQFGLACADANTNTFVEVNATFARERAYVPEDLKGRPVLDIYPPDEHEAMTRRFREIQEKGHVVFESVHLRKDGSRFPVLMEVTVIRDDGGRPVSRVAYAIDITERKRAEEALREGEKEFHLLSQEFHDLLDAIPDSMMRLDRELKILWANRAAAADTGATPDRIVGRYCYALCYNLTRPCDPCPVVKTFETGKPASMTVTRPDGRIWDLRTFPLIDDDGRILNVVEMKRDLTEHRRLEDQLRQAQKMEAVGTLAGGIAHDFNNALTGIFGFGELLRTRIAGDEPAKRDLGEILRCAERASTLTRQLLAYARRQVIEPVNFDLNTLVEGLMKLIGKVVGEHIEVRTSLGKDVPTIHADRGQIEQVLMNLCLNARDAMPGGGRLAVETRDVSLDEESLGRSPYMGAGRYALLAVSDTGAGMDEKTRERVFEPFFTTKARDRGTGLGLAVVYGIVKQHGGFIHLYSEPGMGTAFKVYFPAIEAPPDAVPEKRKEEAVRGGTETILLAEDEEIIRVMCERALRELGYNVLVARDGTEAIGIFGGNREIALAVLDLVMPRKGGREAFEWMRMENPRLKTIFMSGYSFEGINDPARSIPGTGWLQKPFGPATLARKIREVLDAPD